MLHWRKEHTLCTAGHNSPALLLLSAAAGSMRSGTSDSHSLQFDNQATLLVVHEK